MQPWTKVTIESGDDLTETINAKRYYEGNDETDGPASVAVVLVAVMQERYEYNDDDVLDELCDAVIEATKHYADGPAIALREAAISFSKFYDAKRQPQVDAALASIQ